MAEVSESARHAVGSPGAAAAVTAVNAERFPSAVKACTCASVAVAFWQRHHPSTPPGPAWPPFSITLVAFTAISQPALVPGLGTVTAGEGASRSAYAHPAEPSSVTVSSCGSGVSPPVGAPSQAERRRSRAAIPPVILRIVSQVDRLRMILNRILSREFRPRQRGPAGDRGDSTERVRYQFCREREK